MAEILVFSINFSCFKNILDLTYIMVIYFHIMYKTHADMVKNKYSQNTFTRKTLEMSYLTNKNSFTIL